jgi:glycosyltransferase involved in cell wall biosynthesis
VETLIGEIDPAAILVNLPTVERGQAAVDAARQVAPQVPLWGLVHLVQAPSRFGARLGPVRDHMVKSLLGRFDRLITVSKAGALQLAGRYGLPVPAVLHPPTAPLQLTLTDDERNRRRSEQNLPERYLLGVVGRVQLRQKGHDVALRVLSRLLGDKLPVHLVVIGDGPDFGKVQSQAKSMGLADRVSFLGWRNDVAELIPLLDTVLLPSHFEGLPQAALQAASAGVPVVAYAVDGLNELLPPDFLVPHGDETRLAGTVRDLIQHKLVWPGGEMVERALEWGSPERAAEQLLQLFSNPQLARR